LASIQGDKGKQGGGSGSNMDVLIVNPNINQLLNEHDSVTLVVKPQQKSPENTGKYFGD
jgi:hypothetical protein